MKLDEVYTEAYLGGDLYEVKMKIAPIQKSVIAAVKRDSDAADLATWNRRLGHLRDIMLKKLVTSETVKGMDMTDTHLDSICEECILGKMDEKPFGAREEQDTQLFRT